jgi:hypothetical protein
LSSKCQVSSPCIAPTQILLKFQGEISGFIGIFIELAAFGVAGNSVFGTTIYLFHKSALIRKKEMSSEI